MGVVFTCSIDDGHPLDMKMAELLHKNQLQGTFFVPIHNREGRDVLSPLQLRELARHFEIGSHTLDHCYLQTVDAATARIQILEGKKQLEELLGDCVHGFCYPGGKYRHEHVAQVRHAGFSYARTTMNLCFDRGANRFEIPTTLQFFPHRRMAFISNILRGGQWQSRHEGLRLALWHGDWIRRLYKLFDYACENGRTFHLWAHSWEIDQLGLWDEIDQFFRHVNAMVPKHNRFNNAQLAGLQSAPALAALRLPNLVRH